MSSSAVLTISSVIGLQSVSGWNSVVPRWTLVSANRNRATHEVDPRRARIRHQLPRGMLRRQADNRAQPQTLQKRNLSVSIMQPSLTAQHT